MLLAQNLNDSLSTSKIIVTFLASKYFTILCLASKHRRTTKIEIVPNCENMVPSITPFRVDGLEIRR